MDLAKLARKYFGNKWTNDEKRSMGISRQKIIHRVAPIDTFYETIDGILIDLDKPQDMKMELAKMTQWNLYLKTPGLELRLKLGRVDRKEFKKELELSFDSRIYFHCIDPLGMSLSEVKEAFSGEVKSTVQIPEIEFEDQLDGFDLIASDVAIDRAMTSDKRIIRTYTLDLGKEGVAILNPGCLSVTAYGYTKPLEVILTHLNLKAKS